MARTLATLALLGLVGIAAGGTNYGRNTIYNSRWNPLTHARSTVHRSRPNPLLHLLGWGHHQTGPSAVSWSGQTGPSAVSWSGQTGPSAVSWSGRRAAATGTGPSAASSGHSRHWISVSADGGRRGLLGGRRGLLGGWLTGTVSGVSGGSAGSRTSVRAADPSWHVGHGIFWRSGNRRNCRRHGWGWPWPAPTAPSEMSPPEIPERPEPRSAQPTELPTELPTEMPTELPYEPEFDPTESSGFEPPEVPFAPEVPADLPGGPEPPPAVTEPPPPPPTTEKEGDCFQGTVFREGRCVCEDPKLFLDTILERCVEGGVEIY